MLCQAEEELRDSRARLCRARDDHAGIAGPKMRHVEGASIVSTTSYSVLHALCAIWNVVVWICLGLVVLFSTQPSVDVAYDLKLVWVQDLQDSQSNGIK